MAFIAGSRCKLPDRSSPQLVESTGQLEAAVDVRNLRHLVVRRNPLVAGHRKLQAIVEVELRKQAAEHRIELASAGLELVRQKVGLAAVAFLRIVGSMRMGCLGNLESGRIAGCKLGAGHQKLVEQEPYPYPNCTSMDVH